MDILRGLAPLDQPSPHFLQVDQGPPGSGNLPEGGGDKGVRRPAPRNHEQRLEHIMKKAALEEEVQGWAEVAVGMRAEWVTGHHGTGWASC
jgi:hypothetical protein